MFVISPRYHHNLAGFHPIPAPHQGAPTETSETAPSPRTSHDPPWSPAVTRQGTGASADVSKRVSKRAKVDRADYLIVDVRYLLSGNYNISSDHVSKWFPSSEDGSSGCRSGRKHTV